MTPREVQDHRAGRAGGRQGGPCPRLGLAAARQWRLQRAAEGGLLSWPITPEMAPARPHRSWAGLHPRAHGPGRPCRPQGEADTRWALPLGGKLLLGEALDEPRACHQYTISRKVRVNSDAGYIPVTGGALHPVRALRGPVLQGPHTIRPTSPSRGKRERLSVAVSR